MKKFLILIAAVLLVFAGVLGYFHLTGSEAPSEPAPDPVNETAESAPALDREALFLSHPADEVVGTAAGQDVTWDLYFYWLNTGAARVENYFSQMAMYGVDLGWSDLLDEESGETFLDYVPESAEASLVQVGAIERFAEEYHVSLDEEALAEMEETKRSEMLTYCGENATEEDFSEYLRSIYMTDNVYETMMRTSTLYREAFKQLYGTNGEKVSDADALAWLEQNDYVAANHILLLTVDMATGEALSEELIAEKQALAAELAAELQAIEEPEALLARFAELKEQYDEDTGKVAYPEGYTFTSNQMVAEFENTTRALEVYRVSDPVLSSYGYHVILRMPLDPDTVIDQSSEGLDLTARSLFANEDYGRRMDELLVGAEFTYAPGFKRVELGEFIR